MKELLQRCNDTITDLIPEADFVESRIRNKFVSRNMSHRERLVADRAADMINSLEIPGYRTKCWASESYPLFLWLEFVKI